MPSPLTRQEWKRLQRAEKQIPQVDPSIVVFCTECGAGIGPTCVQREAWLLPKKKRRWDVKVICGLCAHDMNLAHRYRVLRAKDMTGGRFATVAKLHQQRRELIHDLNATR